MWRWMITGACAALALGLAALAIWQDGAGWRIPQERIYPSAKQMRAEESALCLGTDELDGVKLGAKPDQPIITCSHDRGAQQDIYVWGDSHARHLLGGLVAAFPAHNIHILYFTSCLAQSGSAGYVYTYEGREALAQGCLDRNARARSFFTEQAAPSAVILHQFFGYEGQFSPQWYAATDALIALLEGAGHRVVFLGGVPRPEIALGDCLAVPRLIPAAQLQRRCVGDEKEIQAVVTRNAELAERFAPQFLDVSDFFCDAAGRCRATEGSTLLFRDARHLTVEGARQMLLYLREELGRRLGIADGS